VPYWHPPSFPPPFLSSFFPSLSILRARVHGRLRRDGPGPILLVSPPYHSFLHGDIGKEKSLLQRRARFLFSPPFSPFPFLLFSSGKQRREARGDRETPASFSDFSLFFPAARRGGMECSRPRPGCLLFLRDPLPLPLLLTRPQRGKGCGSARHFSSFLVTAGHAENKKKKEEESRRDQRGDLHVLCPLLRAGLLFFFLGARPERSRWWGGRGGPPFLPPSPPSPSSSFFFFMPARWRSCNGKEKGWRRRMRRFFPPFFFLSSF